MDEDLYPRLYSLEDRHWWFRGRREVIWALLGRAEIPPSPRILDAGCGTGRNLQEYGHLGAAVGVDTSAQAVDFCRARGLGGVHQARLEELPFGGGQFDLLFALDVLEHLADDRAALAELHRVAAPGAHLVATAPAYRWLWSRHDEQHHHLRRYLRSELVARARAAGWRATFATYFNSLLLGPIAVTRLLGRLTGARGRTDYDVTPARLDALLATPMRLEARLIRRGATLPAGVSVAMVCRRA